MNPLDPDQQQSYPGEPARPAFPVRAVDTVWPIGLKDRLRVRVARALHGRADIAHPWHLEQSTAASAFNVGAGRFVFPVKPVSPEFGRLGVEVEFVPRALLVRFLQTNDYRNVVYRIPVRGNVLCQFTNYEIGGIGDAPPSVAEGMILAGFYQTAWRTTRCQQHGGLAIEGYAPDGAKHFNISTMLSDACAWWD